MDGHRDTPIGMTLPAWAARHRFSVTDYHRMAESGIFQGRYRIELIDGEVIDMAPIGSPHVGAVFALNRLLMDAARGRATVSVQSAIRLGDNSEPEPDLALLRPRADGYRSRPPPRAEDTLLVVEVADSSLRFDREVKLPLYARHAIPEVWIVDLVENVVEVFRAPGEAGYAKPERLGMQAVLEPLGLPGARIAVADVLGG